MEKHKISKLNSNLVLNNEMNTLLSVNIFKLLFQITLNIYKNLVCLTLFNDLYSDETTLKVLA